MRAVFACESLQPAGIATLADARNLKTNLRFARKITESCLESNFDCKGSMQKSHSMV